MSQVRAPNRFDPSKKYADKQEQRVPGVQPKEVADPTYDLAGNFRLPDLQPGAPPTANDAGGYLPTTQEKLNQMLATQLQQQQPINLRDPKNARSVGAQARTQPKPANDVVCRTDNQDFMNEFTKIFYGKERPAPNPETRPPLAEKLQPHGMPLINFTLTEHLIEEKIQAATEKVVGQTHDKLAWEVQRRTTDLRK